MASFRTAVKRSFFARLAVDLLAGSSNMSLYPGLMLTPDGKYSYTWNGTVYALMPKSDGEDLELPGINVVFLDEQDVAIGRLRSKRYSLPVQILVTRQIGASERGFSVLQDVVDLAERVEQPLRAGSCEVWNYEAATPVYTARDVWWKDSEFTWRDESLLVEGGDARLAMDLVLDYVEKTL